jgi:hypothetical protein
VLGPEFYLKEEDVSGDVHVREKCPSQCVCREAITGEKRPSCPDSQGEKAQGKARPE